MCDVIDRPTTEREPELVDTQGVVTEKAKRVTNKCQMDNKENIEPPKKRLKLSKHRFADPKKSPEIANYSI